jgi:chromosome segregation ATPase
LGGIQLVLTNKQPLAEIDRGSRIASFECIDDDGRFCVVRTTTVEAEIRSADDVLLSVTWQDREYRFVPVELDAEAADDCSVEFLIPSRLLADAQFTLHAGSARLALGAPESHAAEKMSGLSTEQALMVQHDQLVDQARRLNDLRAEMRRLHERAAGAEDALEDARARFDVALIGQRGEVQDARARSAELEAALADAEQRASTLEAALTISRQSFQEAEAARVEAEQSAAALGAELEQSREEAIAAAAELAAIRAELDDERTQHADVVVRLTWAEARLEDKTTRVAELDELARRRENERDEAVAAGAAREATLDAALAIARAALEEEQAELAEARARSAELEAAGEAGAERVAELSAQLEASRTDVAVAAAEVEAAQRALDEERAARAAADAHAEEARRALEAERELRTEDASRADERTTRIAELEQELRERAAELEVAKGAADERIAELEAAAEGGDQRVAQLEAELATSRAQPDAPAPDAGLDALQAQLAEAADALKREREANGHLSARLKGAEQALQEKHAPQRRAPAPDAGMGARLIALDMALNGTPREETATYLAEKFELHDAEALLEDVYANRA